MDTKFCKNCKRDISAANFVMHEMHCMRNITLCKHCQEPVPKAEIKQHFEELHAKIACEKCGKQVEKSHLEKHEEEECSKRPMKCSYCELETPQEELASHLEYCGTRTEECHKCGQFIMKKDEARHEDSKCTYPTPKSAPETSSNRPRPDAFVPFRGEPHYDPFVFEEMNRLLRAEDGSGAAGGTAIPIVNDTRKEKMKFTKSKTNKKSEINKQRERVQNHRADPIQNREPVNSQEEQDRLLAMHLAHDLNENDNIEHMIRQFDKPSLVTRGGQSSRSFDRNVADGFDIEPDIGVDSSLLPCEFCGVAIPLDDLVNHQSNCTDDPLSSLMPQINNRDDPSWSSGRVGDNWSSGIVAQETIPRELDNRLRSQDSSRQQPSVINNLDFGAIQNIYASDGMNTDVHGNHGSHDDLFMLPCEFCNDLFPQDVLVQHQAVCEPNSSLAPVQRTPKKQNTEPSVRADRHSNTSQFSSRAGHDDPPSRHLRETLHKYGVDMKEPKLPSSRRYSGTHDSDEENYSTPRRLSQPRKTDSAARTRSTLNDLLTPDLPTSNINYLGHITKQKQSKDNVNVSRQTQGSRNTSNNVLRGTTGYVPSGARGDTRTSKPTNTTRSTRTELEVNGSSPLDPRHSSRSTGSTVNMNSRSRTQPTNTRPSQERGSRTKPFDYGTNKNSRTPNRRYPDQL